MGHQSDDVRSNARPRKMKRRGANGRAEVLLRESEERFRAIVNQATAGICQTDLAGRFTFVNDRYCEIVGRSREELLAMRMHDMTHREDLPHNVGLFSRMIESGDPFVIEKRYVRQDGSHVWVSSSVSLVRDATGKPHGVLAITLDVTEQKQAGEKLRRSEEFNRTVLEASPDCVKLLDWDGNLVFMNANGLCVMEIDDFEQLRGRPWCDFWGADEQPKIAAAIATARRGGTGHFQGFCPTAKGTSKWWDVMVVAVPGGDGKPAGLLSVSRDLTESRRAEGVVAHSQKRLKTALQAGRMGSWELDLTRGELAASDTCKVNYGRQPGDDFTYQDLADSVFADDRARWRETVDEAVKRRGEFEMEYRTRWPDDSLHWVLVRGNYFADEATGTDFLAGVSIDITERKRAEEKLRESEAKYRALFDSIDEGFCIIEVLFDAGGRPIDYRFLEVNPAFERQTGIKDAAGRRMREIAPRHEEHWFGMYGRVALTGEPARFENRAEQLHRWYEVYAFRTGEPEERKVAVLFNDITERRQAEETLRESDARLRLAIDISQTSTFDIDLLTDAVQTDHVGREIYGFGADEPLTFAKVQSRFHPEDRDEVMRRVSAALAPAGLDEFEVEQRITRPGGETRWIRVRGRAFFAGEGAGRRAVRCLGTYIDITDAKRAEEALRELQKLNEDVLNSLTAHIAVLDRTGTITVVNESWRRFARENGADATMRGVGVGTNYLAACGDVEGDEGGDARLIHRGIREVLDGEREFFSLEYPCHSPTVRRWFLLTASPLTRAGGGAVVSHFNITARREAEERRGESEERYRLMTENARDYAIIFLDTEARIKMWSAGAERILGWQEEEVVGRLGHIIFTPEDRADGTPEKELTTAAERGRAADERWHVRKDGSRFFGFGEMIGLFDEAGQLRGFAKIFRDLTERKQMDDALRESEARFRNMADHAPVMVWVTDVDGACTYLSQSWYEFTGQTPETGLGFGWLDAAHPEDRARSEEIFLAANEKREPFRLEYRLRRGDGSYAWAIDSARPRVGPGGELLGYIGSVIDITERKRAEEERERLLESEQAARRAAEEASRLKDEFLATVSHELRTPLTAVIGWTHLLRAGQLDEGGRARALETVERNARAQNQLIEDLLDISRIITGKLRLNVRAIDPVGFIEAAVEAVRPAAEAKGVRLQQVLDTGVGHISGDADRLQQVVWNLLANAIKFTPRGGRVQLRLERVNSHVEIIVSDTGAGIGPEFLPFVFDRFRQADGSTTRAHGGLGLGLAIVRHLVELHGGAVRADSHGEGRGATFTVLLPQIPVYGGAGKGGERVHPRASNSLPPAERGERLDGVRLLVIDDEADTCEMLRAVLTERGAEVVVARSAEEAFAEVERSPFDLLISDIGMPGTDGYELISRVRSLPAARGGRLPAVALTAYARTEDRLRALRAGFQMHVPKPVEPAELIAVVSSLAARWGRPENQIPEKPNGDANSP